MPGLPLHPFTDDRERLERHLAVGGQVVGPLEVDRIDRRRVGELHQVDDARRLGPHLRHVLVVHDDVAPLFELEALGDLGDRNLALALRAPALLLNARLALGVELVEADGGGGVGRGEHPDRDVHEADLEEALPGRSCSHGVIIGRMAVRATGQARLTCTAGMTFGPSQPAPSEQERGPETGTCGAGRCWPAPGGRWSR